MDKVKRIVALILAILTALSAGSYLLYTLLISWVITYRKL